MILNFLFLIFHQELPEFWALTKILPDFIQRLSFCVALELIPLMEIPGVKAGRARQLIKAGFRTLKSIAHLDADVLVRSIENMPRAIARQIVAAAKVSSFIIIFSTIIHHAFDLRKFCILSDVVAREGGISAGRGS